MNRLAEFRIAYVDLSRRLVNVKTMSSKDFGLYLGGRGLGAKILYEGQAGGVDPLGPENQLIFSTGKLVGTPVPTAGQLTVTSKSPATGLYFKSNVGGGWAKALRRAGWDLVVFTGQAPEAVYVTIDDSTISFHDATQLWGKTTREATIALHRDLGHDWEVAAIGPAGENLVRYANIMVSTYHAAGRGGLGAVMGAKRLKAIAVRGSCATAVADETGLRQLVTSVLKRIGSSGKARLLLDYGTPSTLELVNERSSLPVRNFQQNHLAGANRLGGSYLVEKGYMRSGSACSACPIGCHKFSEVKTGRFAGYSGGPEYETLAGLGAGCGVTDAEAVLKGNELCNDYGLDSISAGGAIQWLLESVERGVLPISIGGGLDLRWGDGDTLVALIDRIAHREGVGDLLAEGTLRAAQRVGGDSWKWAVQANGLEQSRVDTRCSKAYALAFAVNPRGPDHLHAQPMAEYGYFAEARRLVEELLGSDRYADPVLTEGKPEIVRWHEDVFAITDSLGICSFATTTCYIIDVPMLKDIVAAAVGWTFTEKELLDAGRRTLVLERCFNFREDPGRRDVLPWRLMNEPISEGPYRGQMNSAAELEEMLERYYELHGLEPRTGRPTRDLLLSLGLLEDVVGIEASLWEEVEVKLFFAMAAYAPLGQDSASFKLPICSRTTIGDILERLRIPEELSSVILLNGRGSSADQRVTAGDVVAIMPPVGGG